MGIPTSRRTLRDNERALIELFTHLDREHQHLVVIVEGRRDEQVLRDLGVTAKIVRAHAKGTRADLIDRIVSGLGSDGEVLILTDFDAEGEELRRYIEGELEARRVRVLRGLRRRVRRVMGNWRCIEEMVALFKRRDSPEPAR